MPRVDDPHSFPARTPGEDAALGQLAVSRGLIRPEDLERCLAEQEEARRQGLPAPPLSQVLIRNRLLATRDLLDLVRSVQSLEEDPLLSTGATHQDCLLPSGQPTPPRIARYEVLREIARGGMGAVYEAIDPVLKRRVALKVLLAATGTTQRVLRLHREAELAGQLRHPNLVAVHEIGREGLVHYIAMDYIEGRTLHAAWPELSREQRIEILMAVAEGMSHAHDRGVIHRDLKPANILLDPEGRAVVTDFGLARWEKDENQLTRTGAILGTPYYMAPEQVLGQRTEIGPQTDVWALGVLLYETLTERKPFEGKTAGEVHQAILSADPVRPGRIGKEVPIELEAICLKALEKDRVLRYPDASEFLADVRRWRAGKPIEARRVSRVLRVGRRWARSRWAPAVALGLVALVTFDSWWLSYEWSRRKRYEKARAESEEAALAGDWSTALSSAERALILRDDPELTARAAEARDRIADRDRAEDATRRLRERFAGLARQVEATRLATYAPGVDLTGEFGALDAALGDLGASWTTLPDASEAFPILGTGWFEVGDLEEALQFLRLARDDRPEDPGLALALARTSFELGARSQLDPTGPPREPATWFVAALAEQDWPVEAEGSGDRGPDGLLRMVYAALGRGSPEDAAILCQRGFVRYPKAFGSEEFEYLLGWLSLGEDRLSAWRRALARRPHHASCLLALGVELARTGAVEEAIGPLEAVRSIQPANELAARWLEIAKAGR